ncbi:MAPEG family protein [Parasphingorhabdus sp.]|uniref:MAPEG family protein n=1 Tax=Parasphingorhabdus sp. TaxID=2709688 RepID=UPI003263859B
MDTAILAPAAVLVLWSLIMLFWMAGTRFPAIAKTGTDLSKAKPGGRGSDLEGVIPDQVNWKSHNYTHLMEQPTLFYATVVILAIADAGHGLNQYLAWAYVIIRIVHSIWQATVNLVKFRLLLFIASTICLFIMAINAVWATLF